VRFPTLMPGEHIYSALTRARFVNADMHISERRFFEIYSLPFHWLRSQTPLCSNLNAVIGIMTSNTDTQFLLRLKHTPFSPWLLSLPKGLQPSELTSSGHRNNLEENPYSIDKRWKFCPRCASDERKRLGFSYWHSNHQLLGARVCPNHDVALCSHDELRYLNFTLPHHWLNKAEALSCEQWQLEWQVFIYALSARIQTEPSFAQTLVMEVKKHLNLNHRAIKRSDKPYFDQLSEQMQNELGNACLSGLFVDYASDKHRKVNIPWVTLSGYSQANGIRHPLYWLAILFWLRHKIPGLRYE